jgi:hypothetical protein
VKELHHRQVATDPYGEIKPVRYKGFDIPHQFTATFYLIDNDNVKVTKGNFKTFKTWQLKLFIRVTKSETVEVVKTEILGASAYKGHDVFTTEVINPFAYGTVQARHYTAVKDYRTRLVSVAVQCAVQSHKFTKNANGSYSVTIGDKIDIPEADLQIINTEVSEETYAKLDDAFYRQVAEIYKKAVLEGDNPNNVLMQALNKGKTTVQGYTKTCREMKLLSEAPKGKPSPVRKTTTKRKKG